MSETHAKSMGAPTAALGGPHRGRWIALFVFATVAVSAGLGYRHFWFDRSVGTGPAGPTLPRHLCTGTWSERKVLLVGIGDSVTAGLGATSLHGYFARLAENPHDEFHDMRDVSLSNLLPNLTVKNLAISGTTSLECLDLLVPKLEPQDPDTFGLIVMTTGGNDIIHNYGRTPPREGAMYGATLAEARPWIDNFSVRMATILDRIEANFPGGCEFFIANVYDPTDGVGDAFHAGLPHWPEGLQVLAAYNRVIAEVVRARPNAHVVDMHAAFLGHGIHCRQFWRAHYRADDPHYWYWDNLEDPNDRGHDALRRLFLAQMSCVLPARLRTPEPVAAESR